MKPRSRFEPKAVLVTVLLATAGHAAFAHDSWFANLGPMGGGEPLLALGTGNQFPVMEFAIGPEFLVREGCRWPDGVARPLNPVRVAGKALILRTGQLGAISCWAQLQAFDVDVPDDKVELYLAEVNATPALRSTWAALHARGLPWKERYTKHARIELQAQRADAGDTSGSDMAVDIRRVSGPAAGSTRAGDTLMFEVRRAGQPLAGLRMELRHAIDAHSVWHETDAQGRVQVQPHAAGEWLLRGVDLRLSSTHPDEWESDFLTLAFSVLPQ